MQGVLINKTEIICSNTGGTYINNVQLKLIINQYWNAYVGETTVSVDVYGTYLGGVSDEYGEYNSVGIGNMSMPIEINGTTGSYTTSGGATWLYLNRWDKIHTFDFTERGVDFSSNKINVSWSITSDEVISTYVGAIAVVKGPLYIFSDDDKTALRDSTAIVKSKLIVKPTDTLPEIVLTENDSVKDWVYTDERYVPQQGFIGQFVARTLSGNLQNISDDFNVENRIIELQIGVVHIGSRFTFVATEDGIKLLTEQGEFMIMSDLEEDKTNWYSLGDFIVTNPEDNEVADNTTFEAMDYTKLFNVNFDGDFINEDFPQSLNTIVAIDEKTNSPKGSVTALWLAQYTCAQAGVEFGQEYFTNSDFEINFNSFQAGETCRDVMKEIAKLAFSWVRIDWDNKCYIDFGEGATTFTGNGEEPIDNNQYYSLDTKKEIYGPINRVYVGMSGIDGETLMVAEDIDGVNTYGEKPLYIYDNPLTYSPELREHIKTNGSAAKLLGLTYSQLTTETVGHPWLKGNENLTIVDMENNPKGTYAFNRTINYSGHIKTTLDSMGETAVEETLAYESDVIRSIKNATILVEKHEGRITETTKSVEAIEDDLVQNYYTIEKTNEAINEATSGWTNTYTTAGGNNRVRNSGLYFEDSTGFEYWEGTCGKIAYDMAVSQTALQLQPGQFKQVISGLVSGTYTVSFEYEILNTLGITKVLITASNAVKEFDLKTYVSSKYKEDEKGNVISRPSKAFDEPFTVNETGTLTITFETDVVDACLVYDLMCNVGLSALVWTQHPNEITTDTVNISKGITITSSADKDVTFKANYDGVRIEDSAGNKTTLFTNKGMETEEGTIRGNANITNVKFIKVDKQTWITG